VVAAFAQCVVQPYFKKVMIFFLLKYFLVFLNRFKVLIFKIKYIILMYFQTKKYFEKQHLPQFHILLLLLKDEIQKQNSKKNQVNLINLLNPRLGS